MSSNSFSKKQATYEVVRAVMKLNNPDGSTAKNIYKVVNGRNTVPAYVIHDALRTAERQYQLIYQRNKYVLAPGIMKEVKLWRKLRPKQLKRQSQKTTVSKRCNKNPSTGKSTKRSSRVKKRSSHINKDASSSKDLERKRSSGKSHSACRSTHSGAQLIEHSASELEQEHISPCCQDQVMHEDEGRSSGMSASSGSGRKISLSKSNSECRSTHSEAQLTEQSASGVEREYVAPSCQDQVMHEDEERISGMSASSGSGRKISLSKSHSECRSTHSGAQLTEQSSSELEREHVAPSYRDQAMNEDEEGISDSSSSGSASDDIDEGESASSTQPSNQTSDSTETGSIVDRLMTNCKKFFNRPPTDPNNDLDD